MRECCSIQPRPHMHNSAKMDLDGDKEQLESENRELRAMCGYLSDGYYKNKKLGEEWRSFGKYTAEILKEELASSESERRVTKGELERLAKENKELKEMCLYLDQSRSGGEDNSLTPPEAMGLMLQGKVLEERSRLQGQVPRYSSLTKRSILQDSRAIRMGQLSERNKEMTLMEMKNRLDRVETERLELIKSLSAAHTLTVTDTRDTADEVPLPPDMQLQLDSIRRGEGDGRKQEGGAGHASSEDILNAVTLLGVLRRLDAATESGFSDGVAEGEAVALRLLVSIGWQKIQQDVENKKQ